MKKVLLVLILSTFSFVFSFAQTPTPTPKPTPENNDDIVKISTALIQVDVTVTDKNGKVVNDLKAEDFEIFENGEKQSISNFSFINTVPETKPAATPKPNKDEVTAPVPPVQIRPEQVRRTIALVVDDLGISFESMHFVRRSLKKFVDEQMLPNDLVAIIRTGGGIGALQQFTSDKRQLYAAIEKIRWNPLGLVWEFRLLLRLSRPRWKRHKPPEPRLVMKMFKRTKIRPLFLMNSAKTFSRSGRSEQLILSLKEWMNCRVEKR